MPRIVGGLTATEAARVLTDNLAVAPDNDTLGIYAQLRGPARRFDRDAVAVVVEVHQAAFRYRDLRSRGNRRMDHDTRSGWLARPRRPPRSSCRSARDARFRGPG